MAQPWFIWNGRDSRDMGVIVESYPSMVYPAERVETIAVPGRAGFLTRTEGSAVYDGYLKTIGIANKRSADPRAIAAWLRGSGELILGSEPDFVYFARVIKEASLDRAMPNGYHGSVAFMVQPFKGKCPPEGDVTWTNGTSAPSIYNPGDVPAKPKIRVQATISDNVHGMNFDLSVGEAAASGSNNVPYVRVYLYDRPELSGFVFDADTRRITSLDGTEDLTSYGTFYRTPNGELWMPPHQTSVVAVIVTNATAASMTITPRWRWL